MPSVSSFAPSSTSLPNKSIQGADDCTSAGCFKDTPRFYLRMQSPDSVRHKRVSLLMADIAVQCFLHQPWRAENHSAAIENCHPARIVHLLLFAGKGLHKHHFQTAVDAGRGAVLLGGLKDMCTVEAPTDQQHMLVQFALGRRCRNPDNFIDTSVGVDPGERQAIVKVKGVFHRNQQHVAACVRIAWISDARHDLGLRWNQWKQLAQCRGSKSVNWRGRNEQTDEKEPIELTQHLGPHLVSRILES